MSTSNAWYSQNRMAGLRRFAIAITTLNVLGHLWFGFEQSWAQPVVAVAVAYVTELLLEFVGARSMNRQVRFRGGVSKLIDFLLSAHISGLACAMLLYANDRLAPIAFAAAVAVASKSVFRVPVDGAWRHVFNPSNLGITATLLLFPWVSIAPPYQFTVNLGPIGDWVLPCVIIASGSFLNARYTKRWPLIGTWLGCFVAQAVVRSFVNDTPLLAGLAPMTGLAFLLFTLYMVTDPATSPSRPGAQVVFGGCIAATYGVLMSLHVVFTLFFALSIVCALRALTLYARSLKSNRSSQENERTDAILPHSKFTFRPRITFQDTNVVGNVYFLSFFRWQSECRDQWLHLIRPNLWNSLRSDDRQHVVTHWSTRFDDPFGATIGDEVTVTIFATEHNDKRLSAIAEVTKESELGPITIASGSMSLCTQSDFHSPINDHPTGLCYSFNTIPPFAHGVDPLDILAWQGKCRELFLADYAGETLRSVAKQELILQTTAASFELASIPPALVDEVRIEMRLESLKCGQMSVRFDYFADSSAAKCVRFAKGNQIMSCKHHCAGAVVPRALPTDLLSALRQFTECKTLLAKIDDILEFSSTRQHACTVTEASAID